MSLKGNLFYNRASDCIVALAQDNKQEKFLKPALTACVVMIRNIRYKWKFILFLYLLYFIYFYIL